MAESMDVRVSGRSPRSEAVEDVDGLSHLGLSDEPDEQWLNSNVPSELAQVILIEFGEENLEKLARAAFDAELAGVQPNPTYAGVTARGLAMGSLRRALGLKPLTDEGAEQ